MLGQAFEVLHGRGQQELVLGPRQTAQPEPDKRQDPFHLRKEPFDLLSLASGTARLADLFHDNAVPIEEQRRPAATGRR